MTPARGDDLRRIRAALDVAGELLVGIDPARVTVRYKPGDSPVTDADLAVDERLRALLPARDEGWLSEESADDPARLACRRVWVVDPLDGTREFLAGVPEWTVSIALVEDGVAVAGGIFNPVRGEMFLGAVDAGATLDGRPITASTRREIAGATAVVSRWALRRRRSALARLPFRLEGVGPMAYTLALVAAGRADATWSRGDKAEWDIAAGVALIVAAGGHVSTWDGAPVRLNRWPPRVAGIVACGQALARPLRALVGAPPGDGAG